MAYNTRAQQVWLDKTQALSHLIMPFVWSWNASFLGCKTIFGKPLNLPPAMTHCQVNSSKGKKISFILKVLVREFWEETSDSVANPERLVLSKNKHLLTFDMHNGMHLYTISSLITVRSESLLFGKNASNSLSSSANSWLSVLTTFWAVFCVFFLRGFPLARRGRLSVFGKSPRFKTI